MSCFVAAALVSLSQKFFGSGIFGVFIDLDPGNSPTRVA
jgi:hypothetical protein